MRNNIQNNNYSNYGLYSINNLIDDQIVLTQSDKNHLIDISPRLSGRVSVASAVRRLSCIGANPKAVIIQNIFPKMNNKSLWKASELLQGQEEAIRVLEVEIGNRSIDTFNDYWHQNISAIGISQQKSPQMDISFKNDDDFISLLGSHRGELTGSAYEKYITNEKSDVLPTVDLQMEKRMQDVVRQGISTNLIKSAVNVSTGGISIAIAKSLIASENGLGAKIYLSRKLKDEELLFGETQGLVIVTLSEEDIMEFERICMTIGVPSTTIGRVTDNDMFTFNEAIKTKVDKLRNIL
jgi:phosphoribosylformylglycinamidine synthase